MKKAKRTDERNSLEQLLIRWREYYNENKSRVSLFVLVIILACVAVWLARSLSLGSSKDVMADSAYYSVVDDVSSAPAETFKQTAELYKRSEFGDTLYAETGDAYARVARNAIATRRLYSAGRVKEKPANDPSAAFAEAIAAYQEAATSKDLVVKSRALYNLGVVYEDVASIANDADVVTNINSAKENFQKVVELGGDNPYIALAQERANRLAKNATVEYYKTVAKVYRELPDPAETESIVSENKNELDPAKPVTTGDEFGLNDDSEEENAEAAEPAPEATEPAPEAAESAPEATEPAPEASEPTPEATEPAPEAAESAPEAAEPAPEATEPAPEATEPAPEAAESAPEATEPAPEAAEPAPEATEPAPEAAEPAPEATEPAPEAAESAPETTEPAPAE